MTPAILDLIKSFGGVVLAAALGALGWVINRWATKMDGVEKRLGEIEKSVARADERWRSFVNGQPSASGSWPLPLPRPSGNPWEQG